MKKGFTLIELLAVIVILAIIAVIAVPIILNIIDETKVNANKRSIDMYAKAVENAVASYKLNGNSLSGSFETTDGKTVVSTSDSNIKLNVEYDGSKVVCDTIEIYEDGKFYISDCKVDNVLVSDYSKGELQIEKVCTIERQNENEGVYSIGDVITCTLSESTDKFYVIENAAADSAIVNVLTEKNIHTTSYRQSDNASSIRFSATQYWLDENGNLKEKYGKTYPAYVYDQNSYTYPIIESYVSYLNETLYSSKGKLMSYEQMEKLGCNSSSCVSAPDWLTNCGLSEQQISNNVDLGIFVENWLWFGSVKSDGNLYSLVISNYSGHLSRGYYSFGALSDFYSVRPVITISTKNIK